MHKCTKCGTEFEGKFCPECGAKWVEPVDPNASHKCQKCGVVFKGKFCPECGTKWVEPVDPNASHTCQKCGVVFKGKFCPECGTKFDETSSQDVVKTPKMGEVNETSEVKETSSSVSEKSAEVRKVASFKESKAGVIIGRVLEHLHYGMSIFLGLFTFIFLLGSYASIEMFGESPNAYEYLTSSDDIQVKLQIVFAILFGLALLGVGLYHLYIVLIKEKKAKARVYISKFPATIVLTYVETVLSFIYFIIGCSSVAYVNSQLSPFGSAGSAPSCILAFGLIITLLLVGIILVNHFLYKWPDHYEGRKIIKEKKKETAATTIVGEVSSSSEIPPFNSLPNGTHNPSVITSDEYKMAAKIRRSDVQRIIFIICSYVLYTLAFSVIFSFLVNKSANLPDIAILGIKAGFFTLMLGVSTILVIISLFKVRGGFTLTNEKTSARKLRQKKGIAQLLTAADIFVIWAFFYLFIVSSLFSGPGLQPSFITEIRWTATNMGTNGSLFLFILAFALTTFIYGCVICNRQVSIYHDVKSLSDPCSLKEPLSALRRYMAIIKIVKNDKKPTDEERVHAKKRRITGMIVGYTFSALALIFLICWTVVPNNGKITYEKFSKIGIDDNYDSVVSKLGTPDYVDPTNKQSIWIEGDHVDYVIDLLTEGEMTENYVEKVLAVMDKAYNTMTVTFDARNDYKVMTANILMDTVLLPSSGTEDPDPEESYRYLKSELLFEPDVVLPTITDFVNELKDETFYDEYDETYESWSELDTYEKNEQIELQLESYLNASTMKVKAYYLDGKEAVMGPCSMFEFYVYSNVTFDVEGAPLDGYVEYRLGSSYDDYYSYDYYYWSLS